MKYNLAQILTGSVGVEQSGKARICSFAFSLLSLSLMEAGYSTSIVFHAEFSLLAGDDGEESGLGMSRISNFEAASQPVQVCLLLVAIVLGETSKKMLMPIEKETYKLRLYAERFHLA